MRITVRRSPVPLIFEADGEIEFEGGGEGGFSVMEMKRGDGEH
jgi:hypothetical protein